MCDTSKRTTWISVVLLSEPKQEYFFRVVRSKTTGYVLVVQFPSELRSKVVGMKDDFFSSFKIVR
jgi:hypothetical protein